jgi:bromodomain-containing factor 1
MIPVDPVALGIPNYFAIIKKPMDLGTMSTKLKGGQYSSASDFEKDMRLLLANCYKFNPAGNPIHELGKQFENLFNEEWDKKDSYLAEHSPPVASPSLPESEDDEDDEEEEEAQNHKNSSLSAAKELLLEHQQKLIALMSAKNKDDFVISMQQELVQTVQKRVSEEEEASKKKVKKPKPVKAPKKVAPPPRKAGATKKAATHRPKYMGTLEKETISAGLMNLPDDVSMQVLEDIKRERPGLDVSNPQAYPISYSNHSLG